LRKYESLFIIRPDLEEERSNEVVEKFKNLLETNGAENLAVDVWGKRKLAYEVKKFNEGIFVLFTFECESDVKTELERNYKISDEIIKYLVVRLDEEQK
jgi:small subunit ribosomal protein S6